MGNSSMSLIVSIRISLRGAGGNIIRVREELGNNVISSIRKRQRIRLPLTQNGEDAEMAPASFPSGKRHVTLGAKHLRA